ncbi:MAG: hypothetical protein K8R36_20220 [Planctomycetales bacterium]|nr:hypothetical protein [Planctomycetales bacterium]
MNFRQQNAHCGIEPHKPFNTIELRQVERLGAFWCDCLLRGIARSKRIGFCAMLEGTIGVLRSRDQVGKRVLVFGQDFMELVREQD